MTIQIPRWNDAPLGSSQVEVDEYVPLRFRTYVGTLGGVYLRLGNFIDSLLEFMLDPVSMTVRGFTLTSFDILHDQPRTFASLPRIMGLPVVELPDEFRGPTDARRIDVKKGFSVGFGVDFVEMDLGGLPEAQRVLVADAAEFYLRANELVGIRVVGLTKQQVATIKSQRSS